MLPGDRATANSNHSPDGTSLKFKSLKKGYAP
jgi:hypothetical protein